VCLQHATLFTFRALWLHARGSEINVYNPDNTSYSLLISDVCYTIRQKSSIPKQKTIDCACIESTWQEAFITSLVNQLKVDAWRFDAFLARVRCSDGAGRQRASLPAWLSSLHFILECHPWVRQRTHVSAMRLFIQWWSACLYYTLCTSPRS
jgi:hypothetical protein